MRGWWLEPLEAVEVKCSNSHYILNEIYLRSSQWEEYVCGMNIQ